MPTWTERRRIRRRAGASANQQYRRLRRDWRKSHRTFFIAFGASALIIYGGLTYAARDHFLIFLGGVFAGGCVTLFVAAFQSPPKWIENYRIGAWGEQKTAGAIAPLMDEGWVVIHDVAHINRNFDHVLIGPAGVFVVDTKNLSGTIAIRGESLSATYGAGRRSDDFGDRLARQARSQGAELHDVLSRRGQPRIWVTAVVVIWADFPQQCADGDRMTYLHGDRLVPWLRGQRARLNANQIQQVANALRSGQRRRAMRKQPESSRPTYDRHVARAES